MCQARSCVRDVAVWVAALLVAGASVAGAGLLDDLTAYWSFDSDFRSSTQPTFNGSAIGNAQITTTAGEHKFGGGAVKLDGFGDYVNVVNEVFPDGATSFSISTWANMQGQGVGGTTRAIYSTSPSTSYASEISIRDGNATTGYTDWFQQGITNYTSNATAINNGEWHQYGVTWDKPGATGTLKYYLDGAKVYEQTGLGGAPLPTDGFHIGADRHGGRNWNGTIDDVAVWSRVLDEAEMATLGAGAGSAVPVPAPPVGLIAEYKFETSGGTVVTPGQSAVGQVDDTAGANPVAGPYHGTGAGDTLSYQADVPAPILGSTHSLQFKETSSPIDYVDLGMPNDIADITKGAFTIETWLKTTDTGRGIPIASLASGKKSVNLEITDAGLLRGHIYTAGATTYTNFYSSGHAPVDDGEWHHAALVREAALGDTYLYLDGYRVGSTTDTAGPFVQNSPNMYLGRDYRTTTGERFDGSLDNVRIWNVARTPEQFGIRGADQQLYRMETDGGAAAAPGAAAATVDDTGAFPVVLDGTASGPTYSSITPPGIYGSPSATTPSTVSLSFDGSNDYVDLGSSPQIMDLPQGGFTIEAWVNTSDTNRGNIFGNFDGVHKCVNFEIGSPSYTGGAIRAFMQGDGGGINMWGKQSVIDGQWHHVAMVYDGVGTNNVRLYVDGALDNTGTYTGQPYSMTGPTPVLGKDRRTSGPILLDGLMDEVRISSVALNPTQFAIRGLEHGYYRMETDGGAPTTAGQTAATVDDTGIHPFTTNGAPVGGPTYSADTPPTIVGSDGQPTTKSMSFNQSNGDYVDLGNSPQIMGLAEGGFTVEGWIKSSDSGRSNIFGNFQGTNDNRIGFEIGSDGYGGGALRAGFEDGTTSLWMWGVQDVTDGQWHHVAMVYDGPGTSSNVRLYVDGEIDKTGTYGGKAFTMTGGSPLLGNDRRGGDLLYDGLMDEVRISGVPLDPTQFVMKGAGEQNYYRMETDGGSPVARGQAASVVDDTGAHPFTYDGAALPTSPSYSNNVPGVEIVRDGVNMPNGFSMSFNGTSDYVELGDHPLLKNLPMDDFTIEFFAKTPSRDDRAIILGALEWGGDGPGDLDDSMNIEIGGLTHGANQGHIRVFMNDQTSITDFYGATNISDDTWHHIALVRSGAGTAQDSVQLYVDYVLDGQRGLTTGQYVLEPDFFRLGRDVRGTGHYYEGLLDEFRITRGALGVDEFLVAVPEPASMSLLGLGLLALARRRRR